MRKENRPADGDRLIIFRPAGLALALVAALLLRLPGSLLAQTILTPPQDQTVSVGAAATFTVAANGTAPLSYQWQKDGAALVGATTASLTIANVQPLDAGIYQVVVASGTASTSASAILGLASTSKVIGSGAEIASDIFVSSNGFTYDQVLLQGAAATITADPNQITRISYVDLTDDIVQVEFSGAGTLSLVLDNSSGPATAVNYNQPDVAYMKGHAGIVIAGANETTNVSIFTVGSLTAANQGLIKTGVTYDGVADLAYLAILSTDGKFGGVRTADASYFSSKGLTGIDAPAVLFTGPVYVGNINAFDAAIPVLLLGYANDVRITGGDLLQSNARPVAVSGIAQLNFVAGTKSNNVLMPAQFNQGRLLENGVDVTDLITVAAGSSALYVASLRPAPGATNSTASGTATLQLNPGEKSAFINVSFSNLSSSEVVAHLVIDGTFVQGLPPGQFSRAFWTFSAVGTYSPADLVAALKAGRLTVEIDTTGYPAGELVGGFVRNTDAMVFVAPAAPPAIDLSVVSPEDAARFLTQATFGPAAPEIVDLVREGYSAWLSGQMALLATPQRAYTMDDFAAFNGGGQGVPLNGVYPYPGGSHRQAAWWKIAVTAPDQLRQRVAFALSEILVVSDQEPTVNTWQEGAASYYDVLVANAFGNFRTLLEQVALHPIMGVYLSALRNGRATFDPQGRQLSTANENFAREVMQLFTIGLNELNPDGTLQLDSTGQPIPTYDQQTVVETAKVFTGWGFFSTDGARDFHTTGGNNPQDWLLPMILYPEFHDDTAKTIVGGQVLPAAQGGAQDLKDTLDALFNHPNIGPFISRQLIQRLVTSNPSPGYVYRVAQVFADNGDGVRGDLGAVVRAILLDYEARSPALLGAVGHGKLKEPLLRATAFLRAFRAASDSGRYNIDAYPALVQAPLRAPTVFNFFLPDYARPGPLAAGGLFAPEFQIMTDTTAITTVNFFHLYIYNPKPGVPSPDNREAVYLEPASLLALPSVPQALVDQLNLLFCAGAMSQATNDRIVAALNAMPATGTSDDFERVHAAIYLVVTAPDGAIQQ